jgi:hypothetical protein
MTLKMKADLETLVLGLSVIKCSITECRIGFIDAPDGEGLA